MESVVTCRSYKWYKLHFSVKKNMAKYKGGTFDLSDLAHIRRLIRGYSGDACYQISEESVVVCWSYKWHKFHFEKKNMAKYNDDIFDLSDLAHIYRSKWE